MTAGRVDGGRPVTTAGVGPVVGRVVGTSDSGGATSASTSRPSARASVSSARTIGSTRPALARRNSTVRPKCTGRAGFPVSSRMLATMLPPLRIWSTPSTSSDPVLPSARSRPKPCSSRASHMPSPAVVELIASSPSVGRASVTGRVVGNATRYAPSAVGLTSCGSRSGWRSTIAPTAATK